MNGDQESDWRASAFSIETGELIFTQIYPWDLAENDFSIVLNKRLMRNDLRVTEVIELKNNKKWFSSPTKFKDIYDEKGYAVLIKETPVAEFVKNGGKLVVHGPPIY